MEKLKELVLLNNQVEELRLQDKLGKPNFHENMKKVFEPFIDTTKDTSRDITKTMMETSIENSKTLKNLNDKNEIMNDRGIMASYLSSPLSKINNS